MFKNRIVLWIALGSLFLNIGVISAAGYVIWRANAAPEPWEMLEDDTGFENDSGESPRPIILQEDALRRSGVVPGDEARSDEEVDIAIEVVVAGGHAASAGGVVGQRSRGGRLQGA